MAKARGGVCSINNAESGAMSIALRLIKRNSELAFVETTPLNLATDEHDSATAVPAAIVDLSREVYGLLGLPIDATDYPTLLHSMDAAVDHAAPFLISTPNVNFLVKSQQSVEFRESILMSDLCLADGMPLIWIAKLLRIPIYERVAGADLFGRLKSRGGKPRKLKVFLLGGADGVGDTVCKKLNSQECGLDCVGVLNPGFGTIEDMSTVQIIDTINSSKADLLAVFFGAEKAQAWLMHNHARLQSPIRAQFGATINFEAGIVKRAPRFLRNAGFEWLWRIKEEPYLWRRYWNDGTVLFRLLITCILPLSISAHRPDRASEFSISEAQDLKYLTLFLSGSAVDENVDKAISIFLKALSVGKEIIVDISRTICLDSRFFGLLLMVRKQLIGRGQRLRFIGVTPKMRKTFKLNRFEFLLTDKIKLDSP